MAKTDTRTTYSKRTKRNAVEAVLKGDSVTIVSERYGIVPSMLYNWRKKYEAGELGAKAATGAKPAKGKPKANGDAMEEIEARGLTPQALFTSRVNRATVLLRQAWQEVKRMEDAKKIKGPDKAHSYAYMALLELQGDNGS